MCSDYTMREVFLHLWGIMPDDFRDTFGPLIRRFYNLMIVEMTPAQLSLHRQNEAFNNVTALYERKMLPAATDNPNFMTYWNFFDRAINIVEVEWKALDRLDNGQSIATLPNCD